MTPEPCVVCNGWGYMCCRNPCVMEHVCRVCMGSRVRPSPWGWTASLGPENSSEVGTGAKDATGGKRAVDDVAIPMPHRETHRMVRAEALEAAVRAERERCARLVEDVAHDWEDTTMLEGVVRRIRAGEP